MTPPRVAARGMAVSGRFRGASGTPPPTVCPGTDGNGSLPLIRPCGATFPQGGRQGLQGRDSSLPGCWRQREAAAGWGHPALRMGDMETLWDLRGHPFPGRRTVGAGHARPGGWREHPSMVRSVGRGLDPSAGGNPGNGRQREPASHPALRGHLPPRGGRQGLLLAAAQASLYPGSWSSVRSWRVRL